MLSPHQATFCVKYDDENLYLAVRSDTRPDLIAPLPTYEPNDWQRKSIANGTHDPVPTYTPSHSFMRLTPLNEQRLMRFVSRIGDVAWRYPHQQGVIDELQRRPDGNKAVQIKSEHLSPEKSELVWLE